MQMRKYVAWSLRILAVLSLVSLPNYLYANWLGSLFDPHSLFGIKTAWYTAMPIIFFQIYIIIAGYKLWYVSLWIYPIYSLFYLGGEISYLFNNFNYISNFYLPFQLNALFFCVISLLGIITLIAWLSSRRLA
jgi:hypothetical protein